jgi:hypothetical protein
LGAKDFCFCDTAGVKGNFLTRIPTALKTYNQTFGGPPDLVILHSNFWYVVFVLVCSSMLHDLLGGTVCGVGASSWHIM